MHSMDFNDPLAPRTRKVPATTYRRVGRLQLIVTEGPDRGSRFAVDLTHGREVTGGRLDVNDIVLTDDLVSGTHFRIFCRSTGELTIRDEDSTNGIEINGIRVRDATIHPQLSFKVGSTIIELTDTEKVDIPLSYSNHFGDLYGASDAMREVFAVLEQIAKAGDLFQRILIGGETGTGKELIARALHQKSPRAKRPFIVFDCTSVPRDLVPAKLFGHRKGSFTGADQSRRGCFRTADTGTLFIDEIGELPLDVQGTLLRVLESEEVIPVGEDHAQPVNVRVFAATHRSLRKMIAQGKFREDLYYRLNGTRVMLPSLRDRPADIEFLARRFIKLLCDKYNLPMYDFAPSTMKALTKERWPGNVRQLRHVVESAAKRLVGHARTTIEPGDLALEQSLPTNRGDKLSSMLLLPKSKAVAAFEKVYYSQLIARHDTIKAACEAAKISDETLRKARNKYNISLRPSRDDE